MKTVAKSRYKITVEHVQHVFYLDVTTNVNEMLLKQTHGQLVMLIIFLNMNFFSNFNSMQQPHRPSKHYELL